MSQALSSPRVPETDTGPFLVGDLGGTYCRLALARRIGNEIALTSPRNYKCADFVGLNPLIDDYLGSIGWMEPLAATVVAVAGPVNRGAVEITNLSWRISETDLGLYGQAARLINDYTALALAVDSLGEGDLQKIGSDGSAIAEESIAVLGAGTGFGVAALTRGVGGPCAIATEGGHASFAPTDELEVEILRNLQRRFGRVSIERLLSGPGLVNLRSALAEIEGRVSQSLHAGDIVRAAAAGDDLSQATLERFAAIYGSVAGDIALTYGARGGVYLAGGIAAVTAPYLQAGEFRKRFEGKGRFQAYLATVPTWLIIKPYAALIGAGFLASVLAQDGLRVDV